jgi:hypothetical protein
MNNIWVMVSELVDHDLTPADIRRTVYGVEYTALDGSPCWRREDLPYLLMDRGEDDKP